MNTSYGQIPPQNTAAPMGQPMQTGQTPPFASPTTGGAGVGFVSNGVTAVVGEIPKKEEYTKLWPLFGRPIRIVFWVLLGVFLLEAVTTMAEPPFSYYYPKMQLAQVLFSLGLAMLAALVLLVCYVRMLRVLERLYESDTLTQSKGRAVVFFYDRAELRAGDTCLVGWYSELRRAVEYGSVLLLSFQNGQQWLLRAEDINAQQRDAVCSVLSRVIGTRYRVKKPLLYAANGSARPLPPPCSPTVLTSACFEEKAGALRLGGLLALGGLVYTVGNCLSALTDIPFDIGNPVVLRQILLANVLFNGIFGLIVICGCFISGVCIANSRKNKRIQRRRQLYGTPYGYMALTHTHLLLIDEYGRAAVPLQSVRLTRKGDGFSLRIGKARQTLRRKHMADPFAFWAIWQEGQAVDQTPPIA